MHQRHSRLPPYNLATNPGNILQPPIDLNGTHLYYLPLPARLDRLQSVLDDYFNDYTDAARRVPAGHDWFGAAAPLVFLTLANYGSLATDAANQGWVAYDEILFAIPVAWYHRRQDHEPFAFKAYATFAPVIYVSDQAAQWLGREVLGWVKTLAQIRTPPKAWVETAEGPYEMLSVLARGFQESFTGQSESVQRLLTITHRRNDMLGTMPPNFRGAVNPFAAVPEAIVQSVRLLGDVYRGMFGNPLSGMPPGLPNPWDPVTYSRLLNPFCWTELFDPVRIRNTSQLGLEVLTGLQLQTAVNTLNRKQFPEAGAPHRACYSTITNAPLQFREIYASGLLGAANVYAGQLSGGYRVHIPAIDTLPLVDLLGLDPVESFCDASGQRVDVVEPVLPTWVNGDLRLTEAENHETRTVCVPFRNTLPQSRPAGVPPFVATRGALRVLPLEANQNALQEFVDQYLNVLKLPSGRFEAKGDRVFVITADYCNLTSIPTPTGFLDVREMTFLLRVVWKDGPGGGDQEYWLAPYIFCDNDAWAITVRENDGFDSRISLVESPRNGWLDRCGPDHPPQTVLRLVTQVVPARGVGQQARMESIAEIVTGKLEPAVHGCEHHEHPRFSWDGSFTPPDPVSPRPEGPQGGGDDFCRSLHKALRAPSEDEPRPLPPLRLLTLKQFRDASQPMRACYQALVEAPIVLTLQRHGHLDHPLHVKMPLFTDLPIARVLGLQAKWTEST
ncbi:MAG: acetoacetate decarboxylase family protein, partial [Myxococcales bacterium]|nr:acetoacetate decarboxylase family protein [Myxococcales bacterium]